MVLSKKCVAVLTLFAAIFSFSASADAPLEVFWEDLAPTGFEQMPVTTDHQSTMTQAQPDAPVVEKYNGMYVKVPGFIVPLEGTDELTTEFLLVPFFGACIHVPPPASNQIVHVTIEKGVAIDDLQDAVWVTGVLSTEGWKGDIASVGYRMTGESVSAYSL